MNFNVFFKRFDERRQSLGRQIDYAAIVALLRTRLVETQPYETQSCLSSIPPRDWMQYVPRPGCRPQPADGLLSLHNLPSRAGLGVRRRGHNVPATRARHKSLGGFGNRVSRCNPEQSSRVSSQGEASSGRLIACRRHRDERFANCDTSWPGKLRVALEAVIQVPAMRILQTCHNCPATRTANLRVYELSRQKCGAPTLALVWGWSGVPSGRAAIPQTVCGCVSDSSVSATMQLLRFHGAGHRV